MLGKKKTTAINFYQALHWIHYAFQVQCLLEERDSLHSAWEACVPGSDTRGNWKMSSLLLFYESTFSFPKLSLLTEEEKKNNLRGIKKWHSTHSIPLVIFPTSLSSQDTVQGRLKVSSGHLSNLYWWKHVGKICQCFSWFPIQTKYYI